SPTRYPVSTRRTLASPARRSLASCWYAELRPLRPTRAANASTGTCGHVSSTRSALTAPSLKCGAAPVRSSFEAVMLQSPRAGHEHQRHCDLRTRALDANAWYYRSFVTRWYAAGAAPVHRLESALPTVSQLP